MAVPFSENGGFAATTYYLFVPGQDSNTGYTFIGIFDVTSFDDKFDGSTYSFRAEDIAPGRFPTVRRVVIVYRDMGTASLTCTIRATDDNGKIVAASKSVQLGNAVPTFISLTTFVDVQVSGYRPQLTLTRAAGGGPVSIISVSMIGDVEDINL